MHTLLKIITIFIILFSLFSCNSNNNSASIPTSTTSIERIDMLTFQEYISKNESTLIDLRTISELETTGIIPGARQIDFYSSHFKKQINSLNKDQSYLIYCRSGNRSGKALKLMKELGFQDVKELSGGINGWLQSKGPIEKITPLSTSK